MNWLKYLTNKKLVMVLFLLLTVSFILANTLPQVGSFTAEKPAWYQSVPGLSEVVRSLGLDRIFSTQWFFAISLLFSLSLLASTIEQGRSALRVTRLAPGAGGVSGNEVSIPLETLETELARRGYRLAASEAAAWRYVKEPWGFWGNFLLHAGMTVTVLFSLLYVLTEQRTLVQVYQGEPVRPGADSAATIRGLWSQPFSYPTAVRLDRLEPRFWDNGTLRSLAARLTFQDREGRPEPVAIAVNDKQEIRGQKVYLNPKFGSFFNLMFLGQDQTMFRDRVRLPVPARPGRPAYATSELLQGRFTLKAKYFGSPADPTPLPEHPTLALRLYQGPTLLGEAQLSEANRTAQLGPLGVALEERGYWGELMFDSSLGVSGIFCGFFVILGGALILYCTVPREVLVRRQENGLRIWWKALRFRDLYLKEGEEILAFAREKEK